jgi:uncharacterized protein
VKKKLKRIMPDPWRLRENRYISVFGRWLHDPSLWHLNRRSAAGAFGVGLFVAILPPVGHMLTAAGLAILLRVNLPLSVALVWVSNPLTIPPISYIAYALGSLVMGERPKGFDLHFWIEPHNWLHVLAPFLLGSVLFGLALGVAGYFTVQLLWRRNLRRQIERRRQRYREMASAAASGSVTSTPSSSRQT